MFRKVTRKPKYTFKQQAVIFLHFLLSALAVLAPMSWLFDKIQNHWGSDAAIVVTSFTFIIVIIIVSCGMCIGICIDFAIRRRKFVFRSPQAGGWVERIIKMWGYTLSYLPEEEEQMLGTEKHSAATTPESGEPLPSAGILIPEKPIRRGRRVTYPLPKWIEVALMWELRDPLFDNFTLSDVIAQKIGTAPNGEPIIGDGAYRRMRLRAIREINRLGLTNNPLSEKLRKRKGSKKNKK